MRIPLLLLFWLPLSAYAQNASIEKLLSTLSQTTEDTVKVRLHSQLSQLYFATDIHKGNVHAKAALARSKSSGFRQGETKAFLLLARGHLMLGEFDRGMGKSYRALKLANLLSDSTLIMASHNMLGVMHSKLRNDIKAVSHYNMALEIATRLDEKAMLGKVYNNLGGIYDEAGDYEKAITLYRKAAAIQESSMDSYGLAISLYNIGSLHVHLQSPLEGLPYLHRSISLIKSVENTMLLSTVYESISEIYMATGDEANALRFAQQSYRAAHATESSKKIAAAAQLVQKIHASLGEYKKAYEYMAIAGQHEARMDLESQQKAANDITTRIDAEARELELVRLAAEKDKQAIMIQHQRTVLLLGGLVFVALLVSCIVLISSRSRIEQYNKRLLDANAHMQSQHLKISSQRDEITAQTMLLQQQNEALKKHSIFKNKVFSVISHDLRSPLNSLNGILKMAQRQSMTEAQLKHVLSLLGKELETSGAMLNNILEWSKSQLDASHVDLEPLDLHQVAGELVRQTEAQAEAKHISVLNEITPGTFALADRERLSFILRNLLSNALKFTYAGGQIRLVSDELGDVVSITICDNGKGITEQGLQQLFTEKRYSTLGTHQEKGNGLGLMLIKEFVTSMGGSISVESSVGKGAAFTVSLAKLIPVEKQTVIPSPAGDLAVAVGIKS